MRIHRTLGLLFFVSFIALSVAGQQAHPVHLQWDPPIQIAFGEEHRMEVLHFPGAVYADSLPAIPMYAYRVETPLPHYRHTFSLEDKVFVPVSQQEQSMLPSAPLNQESLELHEVEQSAGGKRYSVLGFYPFRFNPQTGGHEKLLSFTIHSRMVYDPEPEPETRQLYASRSMLAEGEWYKLCVEEDGVYRLGHQDLQALGVDVSQLRKEDIRLFGQGGGMLPEANDAPRPDDLSEQAIYVSGSASGSFGSGDYLLFYGQSPHRWIYQEAEGLFRHEVHLYAGEHCYFLTPGPGRGKRISQQAGSASPHTHTADVFQDYYLHQRDLHNLIGSGRVWYGEVFDATLSRNFLFEVPGLDRGSQVHLSAYVAARSGVGSSFRIRAGDADESVFIPSVSLTDYIGHYARYVIQDMWLHSTETDRLEVNLAYQRPTAGSRGWLNYIALNLSRRLQFTGPQMAFRNTQLSGPGRVIRYRMTAAGNQVRVWEVTDPSRVREQILQVSGNTLEFRLDAEAVREFIAFDGSSFKSPRLIGRIENQNIHGLAGADLVVVTAGKFLEEAERLAAFRRENDGLTTLVVTTEQVYNEFSSGTPDVTAIRNMMQMFWDRSESGRQAPRYLLLFGNGTVDNKDILGFGGNHIPTYQSLASLAPNNSYMTDDYFGLLAHGEGAGADGLLDIGIGRLPVRSLEEAAAVADKIIRYDQRMAGMEPGSDQLEHVGVISNYADWRNMVVFVADDEDHNTHFNHAETLSSLVRNHHPEYNVEKIYLDAYRQVIMAGGSRYPEVNQAINDRVNAGALLINYIGHGGTRGLAHERVLTFDDINTWDNLFNMPVFMTATCEFSSFDQPDPNDLSAGVRIFLRPRGGAVALYTTTRLAWSGTNLSLNYQFMNHAFRPDAHGYMPRLGDLIRLAKVESAGSVQPWRIKNFVLLGDPSMRMGYPQHQVVTESIPDTIQAFQQVTVSGYLADRHGRQLDAHQGIIYPTVYDKKQVYRTLGNDPTSFPADFEMRNHVLYKGKASVQDGRFSFSFVVPKDIAYAFGRGKISYYADDGLADAHGSYMDFVVGGTSADYVADLQGPEIDLYINDTSFVSGGMTNENPILLAMIRDESGINITGRIGHDMLAFLNGDLSNPILLNRYYQADLDTWQSGRVVYPFRNLDDGWHQLTVRAWDIHNNPAEASIDFIVARSARLAVNELFNYPNPVSIHGTHFRFSHNQAMSDLEVRLDIFDLQGRLVYSRESLVRSAGFRSDQLYWDGRGLDGQAIGNGLYVYRLTVATPDGQRSHQASKLVVLRD